MLYPIYLQFKQCLNDVQGITTVQLYSKQFESVITTGNAVFVAFEPVNISQLIKENKSNRVSVHLYIATKVLSGTDGSIPDESILKHDDLFKKITEVVDKKRLEIGKRTDLIGYAIQPIDSGFLISRLDYEVRF
ncbi:hypothetical protein [Massilibacteroides sp.]|uniref:hypothetical protein n=1 Tax=Massilibacteroides sp. TaxID=2034766 RepID=UPI002631E75E|nr:hypothetical protein [Massilibacteroides sp.]MDD4516482.1 hypothetical protein [Massilibacteroides sp.]